MEHSSPSSSPSSFVALAVVLIGATFVAGIIKWAFLNTWSNPVGNLVLLVLGVLALGWFLRALRRGSNLCRWLFTLLFVGGVATALLQPPTFGHSWEALFFWGQALVQLVAVAILFLPGVGQWFSHRNHTSSAPSQSEQS